MSLVPTGTVLEPDPQARTPAPARGVARDSSGRFLTQTHTPGTLARWGPDGAFQGSVGRFDEGPGEFGLVSTLLAGGWYGFPGETSVEGMWGPIPGSGLTYRIVTTPGGLERLEILRIKFQPRAGNETGECPAWRAF